MNGESTIPELIADLDERVQGLETRLPEAIASEVGKVAGPVAAEAVKTALEPYVETIRDLTEKLAGAAERDAAGIDAFAHAKIGAVVTAVQRAIGITIPMPSAPDDVVLGDVKVTGAETADQLAK